MTIAQNVYVPNPLPGFSSLGDLFGKWSVVRSKAGLTTITSMKIGPDGLLYVLELSDAAGFPTQGAGNVVQVKRLDDIEDVITGLAVPTDMTFGPDGNCTCRVWAQYREMWGRFSGLTYPLCGSAGA